jgi:hypothetical protein
MKVKICEGEWSTSRSGCVPTVKYQWYQCNRRLCGPQNRSGSFREEKNLFCLSGFEHRTTQPLVVCKYVSVPLIDGSSYYIFRMKNMHKISLH